MSILDLTADAVANTVDHGTIRSLRGALTEREAGFAETKLASPGGLGQLASGSVNLTLSVSASRRSPVRPVTLTMLEPSE